MLDNFNFDQDFEHLPYSQLPIHEQLKWDFKAFQDFEQIPNYSNGLIDLMDVPDVIYFLHGGDSFMHDLVEQTKLYIQARILA